MKQILFVGFFSFGLLIAGGGPKEEFQEKLRQRNQQSQKKEVQKEDENIQVAPSGTSIFAAISNWGSWVQKSLCNPKFAEEKEND